MLLFHCHRLLTEDSLSTLLKLLVSLDGKMIIVFREGGINNIKQQNLLERLSKLAHLTVLSTDLDSAHLSINVDLIDDSEFVQFCSDADKIIAWK